MHSGLLVNNMCTKVAPTHSLVAQVGVVSSTVQCLGGCVQDSTGSSLLLEGDVMCLLMGIRMREETGSVVLSPNMQ